mgnify:CR=1 FL=1
MAKHPLDDQIDQLYQLPLDEFTVARNALAKDSGASEIKKLEKPNLAAWTVNQLYWRNRKAYDEVTKAAERMRLVSIDKTAAGLSIKLGENAAVAPEKLMEFLGRKEGSSFTPNGILRVVLGDPEKENLLAAARETLAEITL